MGRKRENGVELPRHVHRVKAKGKLYYFYQAHRGTDRQGPRIALPRDPTTAEFWDALRKVAGTVQGYSGTIAAMIDAYLASPEFLKLADSTKRSYQLYLTHGRAAFGKSKPDEIRPAHVIKLRDEFQDTPVAANTIVAALSAVYKWGRPRDFATVNPCEKLPKFKTGEHKAWPAEMVTLALQARWEIKRFVLLTLATAQREEDVCRMSLHDIVDGEVRVVQQKTRKELWIPLPDEINSVVEDCRKSGTMYLIPRGNGHPFNGNQFRAMWGREMKKEKFKPIREAGLVPHGLCKNAHNALFESGANAKEVEAVTGRSPTMVAHYSKAANQRLLARKAVGRRDGKEAAN